MKLLYSNFNVAVDATCPETDFTLEKGKKVHCIGKTENYAKIGVFLLKGNRKMLGGQTGFVKCPHRRAAPDLSFRCLDLWLTSLGG